jgi:hypothetical protein
MTVVVFCGPTISAELVARELDADVRPPAQRGDLLRAALEQPDAIALIDGYFDRVPSVWHREILWAMSQGIHVFGASSMGALRAAELAAFGMVGIGEIFEAFYNEELEDDDEVAVAHGDASTGYRYTSEAMVNIRWTLRAAESQGIIDAATRTALEQRAKSLPYDQRDLRAVMNEQTPQVSMLREWLHDGRVDQKRADAVALLRHVANLERAGWSPKVVGFRLAETDGWTALLNEVEGATGRRMEREVPVGLADELRARGISGQTFAAATLRVLAVERLRREHVTLNARAVEAWIDEFRRDHELLSPASFDAWLAGTRLEGAEEEAFFRREAVVRATRAELHMQIGTSVEDELRAEGNLDEILQRVEQKELKLAQRNLSSPTLEAANITEEQLWTWFFRDHLGIAVPRSIVEYAAREASTVEDLRTAALRELLFARFERSSGALPPRTDHGRPGP